MTPVEELCARLDELGIKHRNYGYESHVWWEGKDGVDWHAENMPSFKDHPYIAVDAVITPEQAIAATLGSGTCRLVDNESGPDMHCTVCGCEVDDEYRYFMESYGYSRCPHCGRRIEVVE